MSYYPVLITWIPRLVHLCKKLYCDAVAVSEKCNVGLVADRCNETEVEVLVVQLGELLDRDISILRLLDLRGTPPFLPLVMFVVTRLVTLGAFFFFTDKKKLFARFSHSYRMGADTKRFPVRTT